MLHNPSLNERSECRLGLVMAARLTDAVPRRGTMREARNDEAHACNTLYNRTCIRTCSPCTVLLRIKDAFSLSEAGYQYIRMLHQLPSLRSLRSLRLGL